jgi:hypothetical protein
VRSHRLNLPFRAAPLAGMTLRGCGTERIGWGSRARSYAYIGQPHPDESSSVGAVDQRTPRRAIMARAAAWDLGNNQLPIHPKGLVTSILMAVF